MTTLNGRTAVVTGASSGIGQAIASALADRGARVHVVARRAVTGPFQSHQVDVTDPMAIASLMKEVGNADGISILVCAAGLNIPDRRLEDLNEMRWHDLIEVNLSATFRCVREALPYLRVGGGDVVLISSVSAVWPDLSGPAYQAAKAGVLAFARGAAVEEHQRGIRISTVNPGMTDTPMLDRRAVPVDPAVRAHTLKPEDVAELVAFIIALPPRAYVPEVTILPTLLQAPGKTMSVTAPMAHG